MKVLTIVLAALPLAIWLWTSSPRSPPQPQASASAPVPLAAVFVAWYGYDAQSGECARGLGSTHWNDSPNTGGVVYRPELGYYCSADEAVVSWQLDQLEEAGVSVLLVSWWGWGDRDLDGTVDQPLHPDAHMNHGIKALLDDIRDNDRPIRVALIAEPFTLTQAGIDPRDGTTPEQRRLALDWLWEKYYGHPDYAGLMFRWEGRPLVLAFDPMTVPEDERYTVRLWTGRPRGKNTEGEGWQWFFAPQQDVLAGRSDDGVVWVYPRFDEHPAKDGGADYIIWEPRSLDPLLREGAYEAQWQTLVDNRESVRLIVLYGWNLYGEQAHVEPSWGCPASVGWRYVAKTALYYNAFLRGEDIPPPAGEAPSCLYLPLVRR